MKSFMDLVKENVSHFPYLVSDDIKVASFFVSHSNDIFSYGGIYSEENIFSFLVAIEDYKGEVPQNEGKLEDTEIYINIKPNFRYLQLMFLDKGRKSYTKILGDKLVSIYDINLNQAKCVKYLNTIDLDGEHDLGFEDFYPVFSKENIGGYELKSIYTMFDWYDVGGPHHINKLRANYFNGKETVAVTFSKACDCFPSRQLSELFFPNVLLLETYEQKDVASIPVQYDQNNNLLYVNRDGKYTLELSYGQIQDNNVDVQFSKNEQTQEMFFKEVFETIQDEFPNSVLEYMNV